MKASVGEVEVRNGAALVARVVESLRRPSRIACVFWRLGARWTWFGLGGARHKISLGSVEAGKGVLAGGRAHHHHVSLFTVHARLCPYQVDPLLCFSVGSGAEVVVARRRENGKEVVHLLLRVLLSRDGRDFGEVDLVAQLGLVLVPVYRKDIGAQHDVDRLPGLSRLVQCIGPDFITAHLGLARALHHRAGLDDAVELEAAILVDRRKHDGGLGVVEPGLRRNGNGGRGRLLSAARKSRCHGGSHIHGGVARGAFRV